MAKVLLTHKNIEEHICRETSSLCVDKNLIISPGIKDYLQSIGIAIHYGPKPVAQSAPDQAVTAVPASAEQPATAGEIATLTKRIVAILRDEYQVEEEGTLQELCLQVVKKINI